MKMHISQHELQQKLDELRALTIEQASGDGLASIEPPFATVVEPLLNALAVQAFGISLDEEAPIPAPPDTSKPLARSACVLIGFAIPGLLLERNGVILSMQSWAVLLLAAILTILTLHEWPRTRYRFQTWCFHRRARRRDQVRAWVRLHTTCLVSEYGYYRGRAANAHPCEIFLEPGLSTMVIDDLILKRGDSHGELSK